MNNMMQQDSGERDRLARDRTSLANERTLLAYLRTAIMLIASAVALIKAVEDDRALQTLGYVLLPVSIATGVLGYVRFCRMRGKLDESQETISEARTGDPEQPTG